MFFRFPHCYLFVSINYCVSKEEEKKETDVSVACGFQTGNNVLFKMHVSCMLSNFDLTTYIVH
jgi:hypothetical protein